MAGLKPLNKAISQGFTIVELMIATVIFATILLVAQAMFVEIGHFFYRGVSISGTQEVADHVFQDLNGNFQNAQSVTNSSNSGYNYYCIGNARYTYRLNIQVDTNGAIDHSSTGNFGILKDTLPGSGNQCSPPCNNGGGCVYPLTNSVEMLGDKMRVEQFDVCQSTVTSNLYSVGLVVAYGDSTSLQYDTSLTPSNAICQPSGTNFFASVTCQAEQHNNFCAVGRVNTAIYKGLHS